MSPRNKPPIQMSVDSAVSSAFENIEGLRDELQEWYDNLPESFQNGEKGEALQEAIGALEGASQPDMPDALTENDNIELAHKRRKSRSDRRDECVEMLEAAASVARSKVEELETLEYDEDTGALDDDSKDHESSDYPATEDERDSQVTDLETFADECEDAAQQWQDVTFPGMYG